jgi:hypothetical protein
MSLDDHGHEETKKVSEYTFHNNPHPVLHMGKEIISPSKAADEL